MTADARPPAPPPPESPAGRLWPTVCIVLASTFLLLGTFANWADRQLLNTDEWVSTSGKLLDNKDIRDALGPYLVDQLYQQVDVAGELKTVLPKVVQPLAGPAAGGLRQLAEQVAGQALANGRVQGFWRDANRAAHQQFVKILEGGGTTVSTRNGQVQLNLRALVGQIASRVGLPSDLAQKIPDSAAQLTVFQSKDLKSAQDAAQILRGLVWILPILVIGLYILAVVLARGRRRRTVMTIGGSFIVVGVLVLVLRELGGNYVVDNVAKTASAEPAAAATWSIGTSLLQEIATATIFFGFLLVVGGWVGGPMRAAVAVRRTLAPPLREYPVAAYAVALLLALLILLWQPFNFGRSLASAIALLIVTMAGVWALRRDTAREFPGASTDELSARARASADRAVQWVRGGTASMRDRMSVAAAERGERRDARAAAAAPPAPAAAPAPAEDRLARLERLVALRDAGALDAEEFAAEKAALMGPAPSPAPPAPATGGDDSPTQPMPPTPGPPGPTPG